MENTTPGVNAQTTKPTLHSFEFRGDGWEYFKIWIVNVVLTILTLGIYSAWAKVRNSRYFYSNTYVAGSNFRYLAEPLTILKGRLIAIAAFIVYSVVAQLFPVVGIILAIALMLAIPFFINQSLAFNHRMSAYKNIQFRFHGEYGEAFMVFIVWPLIGLITLGILYPLVFKKTHEYMVRNSAYGTTNFEFEADSKNYFVIFFTMVGIGLVFGAITSGLMYAVPALAIVSPIIMAVVYFGLIVFFMVNLTNLFYRSMALAEHGFESSLTMGGMAAVMLTNLLLTIITLGLYLPAAKVRMAKYMASCLTLKAEGSLDNFAAAEQENISALGEEFGQVFDFGI